MELIGPDGLLNQLTKAVLETALEAEMSEHLGYVRHERQPAVQAATNELPSRVSHPFPSAEAPQSSAAPARGSGLALRRALNQSARHWRRVAFRVDGGSTSWRNSFMGRYISMTDGGS